MTTKKQKREAAEAKRAAFEAQVKADGLRALEADRARRSEQAAAKKKDVAPKVKGIPASPLLFHVDEVSQRLNEIGCAVRNLNVGFREEAEKFFEALSIGGFFTEFSSSRPDESQADLVPLVDGFGGPKIGEAELSVDVEGNVNASITVDPDSRVGRLLKSDIGSAYSVRAHKSEFNRQVEDELRENFLD